MRERLPVQFVSAHCMRKLYPIMKGFASETGIRPRENVHTTRGAFPDLLIFCAHFRSSDDRFLSTRAEKSPSEKLDRRRLERRCSWETRIRVTLW